jgi:hypothetical protein
VLGGEEIVMPDHGFRELLRKGRWTVTKRPAEQGRFSYFADHYCPATSTEMEQIAPHHMAWLSEDAVPSCYYCHTPVPDGIQALVHLVRMEGKEGTWGN